MKTATLPGRTCLSCREWKPSSEFNHHPTGLGKMQSRCRPCKAKECNERYHADPGRHAVRQKVWADANRDKVRKARYSHSLRTKYGVDIEEYEAMFRTQKGRCAICQSAEPGRHCHYFAVDHCHKTGVVRGLLCLNCNDGLGRFGDSAEMLVAAAAYLGGDLT